MASVDVDVRDQIIAFRRTLAPNREALTRAYADVKAHVIRAADRIPILIGTLTAMQDLAGINLGIDLLLGPGTIPGDLGNATVHSPGRMSLNAALALAFLGLALLFRYLRHVQSARA